MAQQTNIGGFFAEVLRRDLTPFADTGTLIEIVEVSPRFLQAEWTSMLRREQATFKVSEESGLYEVTYRERRSSYASFISGPGMADLDRLAKLMEQAYREPEESFIRSRARQKDALETGDAAGSDALELVQGLLSAPNEGATRVLLLTGEPGIGKTKLLKRLVRTQAEAFSKRRVQRLYLYFDAQGRALAKLADALGSELNRLRAQFQQEAVAILARLNVLVPIIDGFDELVGASGYSDSFESFKEFIGEFDGRGAILASTRSVYYEQEFGRRARSTTGAWDQAVVELLPWGPEQVSAFVKATVTERRLSEGEGVTLRTDLDRVFSGDNRGLGGKPFFVTEVTKALLAGERLVDPGSLLESLIAYYLDRERKLKLRRRDETAILSTRQIEEILVSIATEMWHEETRELDAATIKELVLVGYAGELGDEDRHVVVDRAPTLACLTPSLQNPRNVAFEHEQYFSFFLGQGLRSYLTGSSDSLRSFLARSVLPAEVGDEVGRQEIRAGHDLTVLQGYLDVIGAAARTDRLRAEMIKENAGILASALLSSWARTGGELTDLSIRDVVVPGCRLANVTLRRGQLDNVQLRRVDLMTTRFLDVNAVNVVMVEPLVDPAYTRLEISGLSPVESVLGVRVLKDDGEVTIHRLGGVLEVLRRCGLRVPGEREVRAEKKAPLPEEVLRVVDKLAHAFSKRNQICREDDHLAEFFSDDLTEPIIRLALENDLIRKVDPQTSGSRKTFYRSNVLPAQLLAGPTERKDIPEKLQRFWGSLEAKFLTRD